ncbi:hypothetical protein KY284_001540 [Solanum tuberosum]|nr:hypothetical protein KY284_001540 [Solanum tuberosum]
MTKIESKISESGASNETIHNTSSPNEVEDDIEASKKRKDMEPRAACWKHFEKFIDKDEAIKANEIIMEKHMLLLQKEGVISTWKFDQAQSRRALAQMIILNELPFSIVEKEVDNASSNSVTVKEISKQLTNWGTNIIEGQHLHVRCMAHILNLIVQDGLKEVDVPTRWNSTYLMLDIAQHFELAFERYSFYDIGFLDYLCTHDCEDGTKAGVLTSVDFLETFYTLTLKVFGSKEPLADAVDKYMKALFDHYVKKSSKVSLFSSSSPTSSGNSSSISSVSGDNNFQKRGSMRTKLEFVRHKVVSGSSSSKSELGRYFAEDVEPKTDDFDILKSSLTPKLVQALISLQDWYRSEPIPINVEEDLEYLELLELDMAHSRIESSIVDV